MNHIQMGWTEPFPINLLVDAAGVPKEELPYTDYEATAKYLLNHLSSPTKKDILLRYYQNYKSFSDIAYRYFTYVSTISRQVKIGLKEMNYHLNGYYLRYGFNVMENEHEKVLHPGIYARELPFNESQWKALRSAYVSIAEQHGVKNVAGLADLMVVEDVFHIIRSGRLRNDHKKRIINILTEFLFTPQEIYGTQRVALVYAATDSTGKNNPARSKIFPYNLIQLVTGASITEDICPFEEAMAGTYYMLSTIQDQRIRDILLMRYQDRLTMQAIADMLHCSKEQVRQREVNGIRMMRTSEGNIFLKGGIHAGIAFLQQKEQEQFHRKEVAYQATIDRLENAGRPKIDLDSFLRGIHDTSIDELRLDTRTWNALARAECDTIGKVIESFQSRDVYTIRNLGSRSVEKLYRCLTAYGIPEFVLRVSSYQAALAVAAEKSRQSQ